MTHIPTNPNSVHRRPDLRGERASGRGSPNRVRLLAPIRSRDLTSPGSRQPAGEMSAQLMRALSGLSYQDRIDEANVQIRWAFFACGLFFVGMWDALGRNIPALVILFASVTVLSALLFCIGRWRRDRAESVRDSMAPLIAEAHERAKQAIVDEAEAQNAVAQLVEFADALRALPPEQMRREAA